MKRTGFILTSVILISLFVMLLQAQAQQPLQPVQPIQKAQIKVPQQIITQSIAKLRGPEMMKYLNKQVIIEGFYYDGSIPMIVDDFQRVYMNMMMPPESYMAIVGPRPAGLKWGDKIVVTGTLSKPTAADLRYVQVESVIIRLMNPQNLKILKPGGSLKTPKLIIQPPIKIQEEKLAGLTPQKYALLIAGGGNPANNHVRYWNDLKAMYNILLTYGYAKGNIAVICADGVGRDTTMPVNYSATAANIAAVFNILAKKMTDKDTLYIMINNHGGGFQDKQIGPYSPGLHGGAIDTNGDEGSENIQESVYKLDLNKDGDQKDIVSVDETFTLWGAPMTDDAFAAEVNKITRYAEMIIQMEQCFSGGFISDLTGPRRTIMSAASPTEPSWAHKDLQYNEFTYWYFAALIGSKPDESGAVNADSDKNGKVSILEAYNFARSNDSRSETPFFEDDGVNPAHSGPVPAGGDGTRSANIYLGDIPLSKIEKIRKELGIKLGALI